MKRLDILGHWPLKQGRGECQSTPHRRPLQKWHRACHRLTVRLPLGVTELQGIQDPHLNDKVSRHNIWEAILSKNTAVSLCSSLSSFPGLAISQDSHLTIPAYPKLSGIQNVFPTLLSITRSPGLYRIKMLGSWKLTRQVYICDGESRFVPYCCLIQEYKRRDLYINKVLWDWILGSLQYSSWNPVARTQQRLEGA